MGVGEVNKKQPAATFFDAGYGSNGSWPTGMEEVNPKVPGAAAFVIARNPPMLIQWFTKNHIQGFLEGYQYSFVYDALELEMGSEEDHKHRFLQPIISTLQRYAAMDVFILSHTNMDYYLLDDIPEDLRHKIRLVYNAGCGNAKDADKYLALGAMAYVGHPGNSSSPIFFKAFKRNWWQGLSVQEAVDRANADARSAIIDGNSRDITDIVLNWYYRSPSPDSAELKFKHTKAQLFGDGTITINRKRSDAFSSGQ